MTSSGRRPCSTDTRGLLEGLVTRDLDIRPTGGAHFSSPNMPSLLGGVLSCRRKLRTRAVLRTCGDLEQVGVVSACGPGVARQLRCSGGSEHRTEAAGFSLL